MNKSAWLIGVAALLSGCATSHDTSKDFFAKSEALFNRCAEPFAKLSFDERFVVNPIIHRAPVSTTMECYSSEINSLAVASAYPHTRFVFAYTEELRRINGMLDRKQVYPEVASAAYARAIATFRQGILQEDTLIAAQQKAERRKIFDGLAAFGAIMAEQDRQRVQSAQANRPVVCTLTGVYVQNTVVCH